MSTMLSLLAVAAAWTLTWFTCLRHMRRGGSCRVPPAPGSPRLAALRAELAQLHADHGSGR